MRKQAFLHYVGVLEHNRCEVVVPGHSSCVNTQHGYLVAWARLLALLHTAPGLPGGSLTSPFCKPITSRSRYCPAPLDACHVPDLPHGGAGLPVRLRACPSTNSYQLYFLLSFCFLCLVTSVHTCWHACHDAAPPPPAMGTCLHTCQQAPTPPYGSLGLPVCMLSMAGQWHLLGLSVRMIVTSLDLQVVTWPHQFTNLLCPRATVG